MRALNACPTFCVDFGKNIVTECNATISQMTSMQHKSTLTLSVHYFESAGGSLKPTSVPYLPSAFAVKRCLIKNKGHRFNASDVIEAFTELILSNDTYDSTFGVERFIS